MADISQPRVWGNTEAYEAYMGRWSRPAAEDFVRWLAPAPGRSWLDVGCGPGALTRAILATDPSRVLGIDPSLEFLEAARANVADDRVRFAHGDALALPGPDAAWDIVVAGLVLNFVAKPELAVAEMARAARPGGVVGAYVWDFSGEMQMLGVFWQAAAAANPAAAAIAQTRQFPMCRPEPLRELFGQAGLRDVEAAALVVPTLFSDFDDYWQPHLLPGSAMTQRYACSLDAEGRGAVQEKLRETLPFAPDGSIAMTARAWAIRGTTR